MELDGRIFMLRKYGKEIQLISPDQRKNLLRLKFSKVYKAHKDEMEGLALVSVGERFVDDIMHNPLPDATLLYIIEKALEDLPTLLKNLPYIENFLGVKFSENEKERCLDRISRLVMQDGT
jgi:hypothetical protein